MSTTKFPVHTIESAPEAARPVLTEVGKKYGFLPNLLGVFAAAPAALQAYLALGEQFAKTSLSVHEREVVLLATARGNECTYCVAVHSMTAHMAKLSPEVINAVRDDRPIADARLEAVRRLTRALVVSRGWLTDNDVAQFVEAGFTSAQILEVLVGVTMKTLSNYTNHFARPKLDAAFEPHRWEPPAK